MQFDIETAKGPVHLVLPLEVVISMARDFIIQGSLKDEAEITELEKLCGHELA